MNIDDVLNRLSNSKFRSNFKLKENDKIYINDKGIDKIESHAHDFILKRLSPKIIINDGKQTPMKGHPVFIAQHAQLLAVGSVYINGIKLIKIKNYLKKNNII